MLLTISNGAFLKPCLWKNLTAKSLTGKTYTSANYAHAVEMGIIGIEIKRNNAENPVKSRQNH